MDSGQTGEGVEETDGQTTSFRIPLYSVVSISRNRIFKMAFTNMNSTIARNIKFFMYKYNFIYHD